MFYFIYQIRLETVPFIEKEIVQFVKYFQQHLDGCCKGQLENVNLREHQKTAANQDNLKSQRKNSQTHPQQQTTRILSSPPTATNKEQTQWQQSTLKLLNMMQRKLRQIEIFHYKNWMDYRASLILRSKRILVEFYEQNQEILKKFCQGQEEALSSERMENSPSIHISHDFQQTQKLSRSKLVSEFRPFQQHQQPHDQQINKNINQSVQKIKTSMSKSIHQKLGTKQKSQQKNVKIQLGNKEKSTKMNLSQQKITKQIKKITHKQKKQQSSSSRSQHKNNSNSQILSSRKKKQIGIQNQSTFIKEIIEQRHTKAIKKLQKDSKQKSTSKSNSKSKSKLVSNNRLIQKVRHKSKVGSDKLGIPNEENKLLSNKNIEKTTEQVTAIKVKFGNKKMTKQQYVQYLVNKNRKQGKKVN